MINWHAFAEQSVVAMGLLVMTRTRVERDELRDKNDSARVNCTYD